MTRGAHLKGWHVRQRRKLAIREIVEVVPDISFLRSATYSQVLERYGNGNMLAVDLWQIATTLDRLGLISEVKNAQA